MSLRQDPEPRDEQDDAADSEEPGCPEVDEAIAQALRHLDGMLRLAARYSPPPFRDPAPSAPPG